MELGTGYIGEGGELNANLEYAQIYAGKGPSAVLQMGPAKFGGEFGGWETRTPLSVTNGMSIEESRTQPFFLWGLESKQNWTASQGTVSVEVNPLILHGEISVNIPGVVISAFYWGDSDEDPVH